MSDRDTKKVTVIQKLYWLLKNNAPNLSMHRFLEIFYIVSSSTMYSCRLVSQHINLLLSSFKNSCHSSRPHSTRSSSRHLALKRLKNQYALRVMLLGRIISLSFKVYLIFPTILPRFFFHFDCSSSINFYPRANPLFTNSLLSLGSLFLL